MDKWRHRITIHTTADVLGALPEPVEDVPPGIQVNEYRNCQEDWCCENEQQERDQHIEHSFCCGAGLILGEDALAWLDALYAHGGQLPSITPDNC